MKTAEKSSMRQKWQALVALALASIAVASTAFSGASFTSNTNNTSSLAAGSVTVTNSKADQAVLDGSNMRPGQSRQGTLTITNSGSLSAAYTLTSTGLTDTPASPALSATLDLKVEDITGSAVTLYNNKLGSFSQVSLGTFAASAAKTYRFTLSWPSASPNTALQNAQSSLTFQWKGSS